MQHITSIIQLSRFYNVGEYFEEYLLHISFENTYSGNLVHNIIRSMFDFL